MDIIFVVDARYVGQASKVDNITMTRTAKLWNPDRGRSCNDEGLGRLKDVRFLFQTYFRTARHDGGCWAINIVIYDPTSQPAWPFDVIRDRGGNYAC